MIPATNPTRKKAAMDNLEFTVLRLQRLHYMRNRGQERKFDLSDVALEAEMEKAQKALDKMLVDQGDDLNEPPYVIMPDEAGALYAVPRDPELADCHLEWSPEEGWLMVEKPAPPHGEEPWRHWWKRVKWHAQRAGVVVTRVPQGALAAWRRGLSTVWYSHHHLEAHLGLTERKMKPLCDCFGTDCEKCT